MTLSDFATFSTAISGLAVTASLIYLALQTHQSVKHTRALIHQGRIGAIVQTGLAATDTDLATAILFATEGDPTLEAVRRFQFRTYCTARFYGWQDTFTQHQMGLLNDDIFVQMRDGLARTISQPAFRAVWESEIRVPGTKFAAFVDDVISRVPAAQ